MACIFMPYVVMANIVLANIVMANVVMAYIVMAYIVMANIVMANIVMAQGSPYTLPPMSHAADSGRALVRVCVDMCAGTCALVCVYRQICALARVSGHACIHVHWHVCVDMRTAMRLLLVEMHSGCRHVYRYVHAVRPGIHVCPYWGTETSAGQK